MRRIGLAFVLALGLFLAALYREAQPTAKVWRIGWLSNAPAPALGEEVAQAAFRQLGYVEGQNIAIEFRWTAGAPDRLPDMATELVRDKVDVIIAVGPQAIRAAKQATAVVPIVMMTSGDPVNAGFVASLARPGSNVTGVSFLGEELSGKLLQLLKQAVPMASRVAVLRNPANSAHAGDWKDVQGAARVLGLALLPLEVGGSDEFARAFEQAARAHANALLLLLDPLFTANARKVAALATKNRLPTIYALRQLVEEGGLMAYGPSAAESIRRAIAHVDKILKGAKPADLPVEQPTKFELVINMKTAKALGLAIPQSILVRADEILQ